MAQSINTNVPSLNSQRNLDNSQMTLRLSLQRLSSGLRVNSARDDAAGLAIAEKMSAQSRGMSVAIRNANDGVSLAQTAEGGLAVITGHLQRMRELATQSASGQYDSTNRLSLNAEFTELQLEVKRVADATQFNGKAILGTDSSMTFQIGATTGTESQLTISTTDLTTALTLSVTDSAGAIAAMAAIDTQIDTVNSARGTLGAAQARFEGVVAQLSVQRENVESARGRIMDADYASETANLSRAQILQQAGTAMLAQANALPQNVLTLLR